MLRIPLNDFKGRCLLRQELEETWVDGERGEESTCPPLHRQTSHKHVLATDLSLEDVVNV